MPPISPAVPRVLGLVIMMIGVGFLAFGSARAEDRNPSRQVEDQTSSPLELLVFERPPYYQVDPIDGIVGLVVEPVERALEAAGIAFRWQVSPSSEHLDIVRRNDRPVCATGWFRTPERETFARFTKAVYQDRPMAILIRSDNERALRHDAIADLINDRGLTFGRKLGFSYGTALDAMLSEARPPAFTTAQNMKGMIRLLVSKRFDYLFAAAEEAETLVETLGGRSGSVKIRFPKGTPPANTRHLMCSLSVPEAVIRKVDAALVRDQRP